MQILNLAYYAKILGLCNTPRYQWLDSQLLFKLWFHTLVLFAILTEERSGEQLWNLFGMSFPNLSGECDKMLEKNENEKIHGIQIVSSNR